VHQAMRGRTQCAAAWIKTKPVLLAEGTLRRACPSGAPHLHGKIFLRLTASTGTNLLAPFVRHRHPTAAESRARS